MINLNLIKPFFYPLLCCFKRPRRLSVWLVEKMQMIKVIKKDAISFAFYCPNRTTFMRTNTLFTKEPDTIEWIDNFDEGEVLYDVGANIGVYTIYAAKKGVQVFSFEPESQNYAVLNKNIYINQLSNRVTALNVALSRENRLDHLYISSFTIGGALNNFAEDRDYNHQKFSAEFRQGVLGYTLDEFVSRYDLPAANHIKIDVDGLEAAIISGADSVLESPKLKSILIELNTALPEDLLIIKKLEAKGFFVKQKVHSPIVTHSNFKDIYNFIFTRSGS